MSGGTTLYTLEGPFWGLGPKKQNSPAFFLPFTFGVFSSGKPNTAPPKPTNALEWEREVESGKVAAGKAFPTHVLGGLWDSDIDTDSGDCSS